MISGKNVRNQLDVHRFAAGLSLEETWKSQVLGGAKWYQAIGRNIVHLAGVPYRTAMTILEGSGQLLSESFKHSLMDQPRAFGVILTAMILDFLQETMSWAEPILTGFFRITRSKNSIRLSEAAVYAHDKLAPNQMKGLFGGLPLSKATRPIQFMPWGGVCWGMSHWFLAIFHALEQRCPDPEKRLLITAKLFEDGAPKQAIVMQAIGGGGLNHPS